MAEPNLKSYIYKILKQVDPDAGITAMALEEMEKINHVLLVGIMKRVNLLTAYEKRKTISGREIQSAILMMLPDSHISMSSVSEGTKAITKYNASLPDYGEKVGREYAQSQSSRAGLTFPVKRLSNAIRAYSSAPRLGKGAPVYLAAVLEYITDLFLEKAAQMAKDDKKVRITPKHIRQAIMEPEDGVNEIAVLLEGVVLSGVVIQSSQVQKTSE